jgi:hypothetical protein
VKVGITNILTKPKLDVDDQIVLNRKFVEYDKTID